MGLIKDGKAPKKMTYSGRTYVYNKYNKCYISYENECERYLSSYYRIESILENIVIILDEENDEFEDIDDIPMRYVFDKDKQLNIAELNHNFANYQDFIIKLISNQKKIIERLNKDE